jgi:hypothetical protein
VPANRPARIGQRIGRHVAARLQSQWDRPQRQRAAGRGVVRP